MVVTSPTAINWIVSDIRRMPGAPDLDSVSRFTSSFDTVGEETCWGVAVGWVPIGCFGGRLAAPVAAATGVGWRDGEDGLGTSFVGAAWAAGLGLGADFAAPFGCVDWTVRWADCGCFVVAGAVCRAALA